MPRLGLYLLMGNHEASAETKAVMIEHTGDPSAIVSFPRHCRVANPEMMSVESPPSPDLQTVGDHEVNPRGLARLPWCCTVHSQPGPPSPHVYMNMYRACVRRWPDRHGAIPPSPFASHPDSGLMAPSQLGSQCLGLGNARPRHSTFLTLECLVRHTNCTFVSAVFFSSQNSNARKGTSPRV